MLYSGAKSLQRSRKVSFVYQTKFEIWAGFGPAEQFRAHELLFMFILSII